MRLRTVAVVAVLAAGPVWAQNDDQQVKSLRNLNVTPMTVHVKLSENIKKYGLTETSIRTTTELELRKAGIQVVDNIENSELRILNVDFSFKELPDVLINQSAIAEVFGDEQTVLIFVIRVYFSQPVLTLGSVLKGTLKTTEAWADWFRGSLLYNISTWSVGKSGIHLVSEIDSLRKDVLVNIVQEFANDYLSVNPPKPKEPETEARI